MRASLFAGCVIPIRYPGMEAATRYVAEKLGIELIETRFGCCPAPTGLKEVHFDAWLALAARNLCLAEQNGCDIVTLCAGCTHTLRESTHILSTDEQKRSLVNDLLAQHGKELHDSTKISHLADILARDNYLDYFEKACVRPLSDLKVGTHYGCHYLRPAHIMQDNDWDPRFPLPESMELILECLGARVIPYNRQDLCCGATLSINTGMSQEALQVTGEKLMWMNEAKLDALIVACPTCFHQFDTGQLLLQRKDKSLRVFPVYHISEIVAYALGIDLDHLYLKVHRIPVNLVTVQNS